MRVTQGRYVGRAGGQPIFQICYPDGHCATGPLHAFQGAISNSLMRRLRVVAASQELHQSKVEAMAFCQDFSGLR